jgi:hypothetical protein
MFNCEVLEKGLVYQSMLTFQVHSMKEAYGKLINRPTQTGGKTYDKFFIYVPIEVARDTAFPFKANEKLKVIIDIENKRLIVEEAI